MFSYYGSKSKIVDKYPAPKYNTIIEPFAGAAWYSLRYRDRDVVINDKNPVIYGIWEWLINEATEKELLNNNTFYKGDNISKLDIDERHKDFLGFCINRGSIRPCNIIPKWSCQSKKDYDWASTVDYQVKRAARILPEIKHWRITNNDYSKMNKGKATYFIDPPYQHGGELYPTNDVNYEKLKNYVFDLEGQIMVCENSKNNWIESKPITDMHGQRVKTTEHLFLIDSIEAKVADAKKKRKHSKHK